MRHLTLTALLVLTFVTPMRAEDVPSTARTLPPELAQVLKHVPADTHLVFVVPSVEKFVAGLSAFGKGIGSQSVADVTAEDLLVGPLGDALTALDVRGPFVLAASAESDEPLLLMKVVDLSVWEGSAKSTRLDAGMVFEFETERYAGVTPDGVAVVTRERADAQRGLQAAGEFASDRGDRIASLLTRRDAVLLVDVQPWIPRIEQNLLFFEQSLCCGIAAAGPEGEAATQFWRIVFDKFRLLISQADTYAAGVAINGAGVLLADQTTFATDGSVAEYLAQVGHTNKDVLRGLPDGDPLLAFGSEWTVPPGTPSLNEILTKVLLKVESLKEKVGVDKLEAAMRLNVETYRMLTGLSGMIEVGDDACSLRSRGLYLTQHRDSVRDNLRQAFTSCPELIDAWGTFPAKDVTHTHMQIEAVDTDVYAFNFDADRALAQPVLSGLYGVQPKLFVAPHPDGIAYSLGSEQGMRRFFGADQRQLSGNPRLRALRKQLSPDPQLCVVVDVSKFLDFISGVMGTMGIPAPFLAEDAGDHPLAGAAVYLEPRAVRFEAYVPAETVGVVIERFFRPQLVGSRP